MSQRTDGEVVGGLAESSRGLRRVYKAPIADRLDVGQTAQGEPDPVYEGSIDDWGRLGTS